MARQKAAKRSREHRRHSRDAPGGRRARGRVARAALGFPRSDRRIRAGETRTRPLSGQSGSQSCRAVSWVAASDSTLQKPDITICKNLTYFKVNIRIINGMLGINAIAYVRLRATALAVVQRTRERFAYRRLMPGQVRDGLARFVPGERNVAARASVHVFVQ